ncbi:chlorophyll b reductase chloroplastic-like [Trifolium pratense]|uniref:Chlorophyll b reductase chloroplastic-like n=1 Tax=Trifolium pratense TaxID=57577 RepID=A0A2K3NVR1_TRIPR|nr:chlorophyll b reductase chloroplastic-like [Trifolium pratense]
MSRYSFKDERVETAVKGLREEFGEQHVWGTTCDVRNGEDVKKLVSFAKEKLKYIDIWLDSQSSSLTPSIKHFPSISSFPSTLHSSAIYNSTFSGSYTIVVDYWPWWIAVTDFLPPSWLSCERLQRHGILWWLKMINNAGSNAYSYKPLAEASDEDLIEVVTTNTLGLMICCREAIKLMGNQPRGGHIFNIDGAGSDGRPTPRFAAYGATKRSVVHLTKSLQAELQMQDVKNVMVHNLSPGMVTTDLLMSGANTKQAKFFINVLAEPAEVVAEYLVPNIRSIPTNRSMKPTYIRFLTGLKAYSQIFSRFAFGARRNRYIIED